MTILPCGTLAESEDRDRDRSRRANGIAAEQRTGKAFGVDPQAGARSSRASVVDVCRQRERHQEAERLCALGREIREIHPQRFARDRVRRIVGKKVHAADDRVGGQDELVARGRREDRGVVGQRERARMRRKRLEEPRDQLVLAGLRHA